MLRGLEIRLKASKYISLISSFLYVGGFALFSIQQTALSIF